MKITDMIKAPFSLGLLGLVILLMGVVLLAASFNVWLTPAFDASMERMALLDALEPAHSWPEQATPYLASLRIRSCQ